MTEPGAAPRPVIAPGCIACGECRTVCPTGAIRPGDGFAIDPEVCSGCGLCIDQCLTSSIDLPRSPLPR